MTDAINSVRQAAPVIRRISQGSSPVLPPEEASPQEILPSLDRVENSSSTRFNQKAPPASAQAGEEPDAAREPLKITLIHTNDLQGMADPAVHLDENGCAPELEESFLGYTTTVNPSLIKDGKVPLAALMQSEVDELKKQEDGHYLLLGSGDIDQSHPLSGFNQAQVFDLVDDQGYDAQCPGNHEFDFGDEKFISNLRNYKIPFVASNVVDAATGKPLEGLPPYMIREVNGVRVGIIGLACPQTPQYAPEGNLDKVRFLTIPEMKVRTQEIVDSLKDPKNPEKVDLVLALTHLGYKDDRTPFDDIELARQTKGIDVILGGHSHRRTGEAFKIEGTDTFYAQDGSFFASVGKMDLMIDPKTKKILGARHALLSTVDGKVQPDPEILALTKRYEEMNTIENSRVVGFSDGALTASGLTDSPLGNFMTDSIREESGSDIALVISKLAASSVPAGEIPLGKIRDSVTYDSHLITMEMSGEQLTGLLWNSCRGAAKDVGKSRLLQQSGLKVVYDQNRPDKPPAVTFRGEGLPKGKKYRVALDGTTFKYIEKELPQAPHEKNSATLVGAMTSFLERHNLVAAERDFRIQDSSQA
ncbi:MAG: bifunctional UDP-sugar hydrolase/5'-nucleotidase [bacterium]